MAEPEVNVRSTSSRGRIALISPSLRAKYSIDRIVGLVAIVVCFPVGIALAMLISAEALLAGDSIRVIFSERRLSAGREFPMFKFRVVPVRLLEEHLASAPLDSVRLVERKRENVTRIGRLLKVLQLDQLPQLLNVVRGEMSIVGPRPYSVDEWQNHPTRRIPARRMLKAGLIGPYQAVQWGTIGGNAADASDAEYYEFAQRARVAKLVLKDVRIIAQGVTTLFARLISTGGKNGSRNLE